MAIGFSKQRPFVSWISMVLVVCLVRVGGEALEAANRNNSLEGFVVTRSREVVW